MRIQRAFWSLVLLSAVVAVPRGRVSAGTFLTEDFETGAASWTLESPWAITDEDAHEPIDISKLAE